jgi:hypothetical protein
MNLAIILNELSLENQFNEYSILLNNFKNLTIVISAFEEYKLPVLKSYNFYNLELINNKSLNDLFKNTDDEIRAFRNIISKLINEPYWEVSQLHNCQDKYVCNYTTSTCNYGLAEAFENLKVVVSFLNSNFNDTIEVIKNNKHDTINNITCLVGLTKRLSYLIKNKYIKNDINNNLDFSYKKVVANIYHNLNLKSSWFSKDTNEAIASKKEWGEIFASLYFWKINNSITNKNDRNVFCRKIGNNIKYLTIDTETGAFELFDKSGIHLGEYFYDGEISENPKKHKLNVK